MRRESLTSEFCDVKRTPQQTDTEKPSSCRRSMASRPTRIAPSPSPISARITTTTSELVSKERNHGDAFLPCRTTRSVSNPITCECQCPVPASPNIERPRLVQLRLGIPHWTHGLGSARRTSSYRRGSRLDSSRVQDWLRY